MNYKIVVNKNNPYDESLFINRILKKASNCFGEEFLLEKKTLKAYLDLQTELEKEDIYITIDSGYRTLDDQEKLINKFISKHGKDYVSKYVAEKGTSEHHTGLCFDIDILIDGKVISENEKIYNEISGKIFNKLKEFGLILRYPKGKESITGYNYEPWHFRYVGKSTAKIIMNNNLTLEEYDKLYNQSGVLIVNKPKGVTSRDIVNQIEKIYDTKKVGHNGTLDPLAEGVLVVTVNKATKINELLTAEDKEYIAEAKVGILTDTLDITGNIIETSNKEITKEILEDLFKNFNRSYLQEVPKYSAVKVNGKKLYEYARNDIDIELPKRLVEIKELELLEYNKDSFKFRIVVSKGTYIRSIIKDMGDFINIPCTMSSLTRTRQGKFKLDEAINLEDININTKLLSIEDSLNYKVLDIKESDIKKVFNGSIIDNSYNINDKIIFKKDNNLIAIYEVTDNKLKCFKMF